MQLLVHRAAMAEADQIDARSQTPVAPARCRPRTRLEATPSRMAQLHLAWPPRLVPRPAEHFETLTHADLVYEVKSSTQTESYTP